MGVCVMAPDGLVDLHAHGGVGATFGADPVAAQQIVAHHRAQGVAAVVASLVTASGPDLHAAVGALAALVAEGALGGIHLEGPFLSPVRHGAHDLRLLQLPDPGLVDLLAGAAAQGGAPNALVHWTFAPELPGSEALVRRLVNHGIRPAIGHTDADAATVQATIGAITDGLGQPALVTHLGNGMPPFHHRRGGPFAAALAGAARGDAIVEVIADGTHLDDDEVVRMIFETVPAERIALVFDAISATGLGDGEWTIGTMPVTVRAGVATITGTSTIAGSTSTLADIVRRCIDVIALDPTSVRTAATTTPRSVLSP